MNFKQQKLGSKELNYPVRYDNKQQVILDARGIIVCDVRNWRRNKALDKTVEGHDVGEIVTKLLNELRDNIKNVPNNEEQLEETMIFI